MRRTPFALRRAVRWRFALPFVSAPLVASAALEFENPLGPKQGSLLGIICTVRDGLFPILLVFGVLAFLVAALLYFTAGGEAAKVSAAKKALVVAVIGVGLAMLSFGLPSIVAELFGVDVQQLPAQCR